MDDSNSQSRVPLGSSSLNRQCLWASFHERAGEDRGRIYDCTINGKKKKSFGDHSKGIAFVWDFFFFFLREKIPVFALEALKAFLCACLKR